MRPLLSKPGSTSKTLRGKSARPTLGSRPEINTAHHRIMPQHVAPGPGTESSDTTGHTVSDLVFVQKLCLFRIFFWVLMLQAFFRYIL